MPVNLMLLLFFSILFGHTECSLEKGAIVSLVSGVYCLLHDGNLLGNDLLLNFCMKTFPVNCSFLMFLCAGNSSMFRSFLLF